MQPTISLDSGAAPSRSAASTSMKEGDGRAAGHGSLYSFGTSRSIKSPKGGDDEARGQNPPESPILKAEDQETMLDRWEVALEEFWRLTLAERAQARLELRAYLELLVQNNEAQRKAKTKPSPSSSSVGAVEDPDALVNTMLPEKGDRDGCGGALTARSAVEDALKKQRDPQTGKKIAGAVMGLIGLVAAVFVIREFVVKPCKKKRQARAVPAGDLEGGNASELMEIPAGTSGTGAGEQSR
ncbi:hypothetical protein QFC22_006109 [Naganishia vaughanmartiniae]|uniref:Uncharacterized protein n=1 Tax=Naganishia vaughanmartiniae TaxID=1424756 RepID=A0ACC2WNM3_9TREE|nr:hypothetical protein QFC22_006109 [Naganishia vaughanmartiniae]